MHDIYKVESFAPHHLCLSLLNASQMVPIYWRDNSFALLLTSPLVYHLEVALNTDRDMRQLLQVYMSLVSRFITNCTAVDTQSVQTAASAVSWVPVCRTVTRRIHCCAPSCFADSIVLAEHVRYRCALHLRSSQNRRYVCLPLLSMYIKQLSDAAKSLFSTTASITSLSIIPQFKSFMEFHRNVTGLEEQTTAIPHDHFLQFLKSFYRFCGCAFIFKQCIVALDQQVTHVLCVCSCSSFFQNSKYEINQNDQLQLSFSIGKLLCYITLQQFAYLELKISRSEQDPLLSDAHLQLISQFFRDKV